MFNIIELDKFMTQVDFENASFYFAHRMPIGFKTNGAPGIYVRDEQFGHRTQNFIAMLNRLKPIKRLPVDEFKKQLALTYRSALIHGIKVIMANDMNLATTIINKED